MYHYVAAITNPFTDNDESWTVGDLNRCMNM